MPKSDFLKKIKFLVDGEEIPSLISFPEYVLEDTNIEDVPGQFQTVPVGSGTMKIPTIPVTFKVTRDSPTEAFFETWYRSNEYKNVTIVRTDQDGTEVSRRLWANTEVTGISSSAFDAKTPSIFQIIVTFAPGSIREPV